MKPVIGIDLGTSTSAVAAVRDGRPVVLADSRGVKIQPSVVAFTPSGEILVGDSAKRRRAIDPRNTIFSTKRLLGREMHSEEVKILTRRAPYRIIEGAGGLPAIDVRGRAYTAVEMAAILLTRLRDIANEALGTTVERCVIAVPAHFNDLQRQATIDAARVAGLEVARIVNEPTAAVLATAYQKREESRRVVVYDLGGGTFDLSLLSIQGNLFEVLASTGDDFLGGDDIDYKVADWIRDQVLRAHRWDLRSNETSAAQLLLYAEQVKIALSTGQQVDIKVSDIEPTSPAAGATLRITREKLNDLALDLFQRTFQLCDELLESADMDVDTVDEVLLAGGSTRIPMIGEAVSQYFLKKPLDGVDPEEIVALGAAVQGEILGGDPTLGIANAAPMLVIDVTPLALGVVTAGGEVEPVIGDNTRLPAEASRVFTTVRDSQRQLRVEVVAGEPRFSSFETLGELVIDDLPSQPRGGVRVEVRFSVNTNGLVQVQAVELGTGRRYGSQFMRFRAPEREIVRIVDAWSKGSLPAAIGG